MKTLNTERECPGLKSLAKLSDLVPVIIVYVIKGIENFLQNKNSNFFVRKNTSFT
jgi:hypothetical protein